MKTLKSVLFLLLFVSSAVRADGSPSATQANTALSPVSQILHLDGHPMHYAQWGAPAAGESKPVIMLLSGPIDTWHSDSAWWFSLAPLLAEKWHVIALDRAGQVLATPNAPVGYHHFADDLAMFNQALGLRDVSYIAFASANLSLIPYLQQHPTAAKQVIMIDPDVLSAYSTARYKKDAQPFVDNAEAYAEYVAAGKYTARVQQKNGNELTHLQSLVAADIDMGYLQTLQAKRLDINNQLNFFREIARYGDDLDGAFNIAFPASIPLTIIDTQFEQAYIDASDDDAEKQELKAWMADAKTYYQQLATSVEHGRYLEVDSQEHLYHIVAPQQVIDQLQH